MHLCNVCMVLTWIQWKSNFISGTFEYFLLENVNIGWAHEKMLDFFFSFENHIR